VDYYNSTYNPGGNPEFLKKIDIASYNLQKKSGLFIEFIL